ncbi:MAG: SulP family inorganic anion transporter [Saprospiraceae bacterium]
MMFSAIFTGAMLFAFGRFKFGKLVRFLPFPVIRGFLAAIGLALILGGISTTTNKDLTIYTCAHFLSLSLLVKWLPGVVLAIALYKISAYWKSVLAFPVILGSAFLLFYSSSILLEVSTSSLMADGWLLGPFAKAQAWAPPDYTQILSINWDFLIQHLGIIATIPFVCFIGGLLMLSAIELTTGTETDANFELETMGLSNLLSGIFGGGFIGHPSTTFTVMQFELGATTRLVGILSAIITGVVLVTGIHLLGFIPRFIVGGLLIFFGYQFLNHWAIKAVQDAPHCDLYIIATIIITSLWFGFVPSIIFGLIAASVFFLYQYCQTSVIRQMATRASQPSQMPRNTLHQDWLQTNGTRIAVFGLQGYIFFGNVHSLREQVMSYAIPNHQEEIDYIILDFRYVTGMDTSVLRSFQKLQVQLLRKDINLVFAELSSQQEAMMYKIGFFATAKKGIEPFATLDEALTWCEDQLLTTNSLLTYQAEN